MRNAATVLAHPRPCSDTAMDAPCELIDLGDTTTTPGDCRLSRRHRGPAPGTGNRLPLEPASLSRRDQHSDRQRLGGSAASRWLAASDDPHRHDHGHIHGQPGQRAGRPGADDPCLGHRLVRRRRRPNAMHDYADLIVLPTPAHAADGAVVVSSGRRGTPTRHV